jgi:hypothetical protein
MKKKYFVYSVIILSLLIFSAIPAVNYITDLSRTLHHDYRMRYAKFHPHKLFLKNVYLMDNKEKYDTLVYGSSRGGFIDVERISKHAYNMSHGFGTITTYLHSLKALLNNGVKVKHVWIGLNDFDTWKDHTPELHRLIYHNNIFQDIRFYAHWLFRIIPGSITILKEDLPLIRTYEMTDPQKKVHKARSQQLLIRGKKRDIPPATLGYTGIFRIDEAVKEVVEMKELCRTHGIDLTIFIYPTFYKTYLRYNQNRIEEFKRKLAQVTDYYDFYDIDKISINNDNWFEGSHFIPDVGDYIIDSIHQNRHLVTKANVEARIREVRSHITNIVGLHLGRMYHYKPYTDLSPFKIIFDLTNPDFGFSHNDQMKITRNISETMIKVTGNDPHFIIDRVHTDAKQVFLTWHIISDKETTLQIFFKENQQDTYDEKHSYSVKLKKGENQYRLTMYGKYINNGLRIDLAKKPGNYRIVKFNVREVK